MKVLFEKKIQRFPLLQGHPGQRMLAFAFPVLFISFSLYLFLHRTLFVLKDVLRMKVVREFPVHLLH